MSYSKGTKTNGGNAHITTCYDNDGTTFDAENVGGNTHIQLAKTIARRRNKHILRLSAKLKERRQIWVEMK